MNLREAHAQNVFGTSYGNLSAWGKKVIDELSHGQEELVRIDNKDALEQRVTELENLTRRQARELSDLWEENEELKMERYEDNSGRGTGQRKE